MRCIATLLALMVTASLLAGCVYDPYTGTYVPCCNYYGYPYYRYPYYPYSYPPGPYTAPLPAQPGAYPSQPYPSQPYPNQPPPRPGAMAYPQGGGGLAQRFAAANVTHDGRLTRDQASAGMPMVARHFDEIDVDQKGYATLSEVRTYAMTHRAELQQQRSGEP